MSDICLNCNGLIMEPNKPYGYSGPVCHCPINPANLYQRPASKQYTYGINIPKPEPIRYAVIINSSCKNCKNNWVDTIDLTLEQPRTEPTSMEWDYCSKCYKEENE